MKILVVLNSLDERSKAEHLLADDYPGAEQILVTDQVSLLKSLQHDLPDLAIASYHLDWVSKADLLQTIKLHRLGLPLIIYKEVNEAEPTNNYEALHLGFRTINPLLDSPFDIILLFDLERRVLLANQTFYQRSYKNPDEVRGRTLFEILPHPLAEKKDAMVRQALETGKTIHFEEQGVDGWFDSTVIPIFNPQGQIIHAIVYARDLTDRKDLERDLRVSQAMNDALLNAPTDLITLFDRDGKILTANKAFCQRFNIEGGGAAGLTLSDLLPASLVAARSSVVRQAFETGEVIHIEDIDEIGGFESTVYPVFDHQNEVMYVAAFTRDVTDRLQMEERQRRDQRVMLAIANEPKNIFMLLDRLGTILMTNELMARSYDRSIDEMIGLCYWDLLPKTVAEFRRSVFDKVIQTGVAERVDDQGKFGLYDSWVIPIPDDQGEIIQVVIIARDITDRKQMELALKASEEKYRTLVETSPDGIAYQDLAGNLLFVNQQFAALFGYDGPEEIYNLAINGADLLDEQDLTRRKEIMLDAWQNGNMRESSFAVHRKDGSRFQLEVNGSMVYDPEGKPTGVMTVSRDITERKRIQDELVRVQENLERRVLERTAELQALNRQLQKEVFLRKAAEDRWKRHAVQSETLARVASRANAHLDIDAVMETICAEVIRAISYPVCSISLYREDDDSLYIAGYASKVTVNFTSVPPVPRPLYEEYIRQFGSIITIPDAADYPATAYLTNAATPNIRTLVIMPFYHMGEMVGALNLASVGEIRLPNDDEIELMHAISDQAALSIMNARLFKRVSDSQARLKLLTERLVEVQEDERRRLARELHDEIGQMLTSLSLNLEIISRSVQEGEEKSGIQNELEITKRQIKLLLEEVRDLSLNLLPAMLDDLGLVPALLDHCQRFTSQTGIQVNLSHRDLEERVPPHIEIAAYRIVQEALTNAARHADVDQVDVRLWATTKRLGIQIEDQGVGFDLEKIDNTYHSQGIAGMRERAIHCGGNLEIDTSPGNGVCLTAEFPLTKVSLASERP